MSNTNYTPKDSIAEDQHQKKTNRYGIGGTPIFAYDPDLGIRYGVVVNLFDFGDRSKFPDYFQYIYLRVFNSTKGSSHFSAIFDNHTLIPKTGLSLEATYINDTKLDFWGFNGLNSIYEYDYINPDNLNYINNFYYAHRRSITRFSLNLRTKINNSHWRILSGLSYLDYKIQDIDFKSQTPPNHNDGRPFIETTLYSQYIDWGVIRSNEATGGSHLNFLAGIALDTRNNKINCTEGKWLETYFIGSFSDMENVNFLKHIISFRHYILFNKNKSVITYRISSQQKIAGNIPFYSLATYYDTRQNQDGPGSAFTMRGVFRNRFAADGYVLTNIEVRKNILNFRFMKLNWQTEISAFTDGILVTNQYEFDKSSIPDEYLETHFKTENQKYHFTLGAGLYFIYNENNIMSVNLGYSQNSQIGILGLYVGSSFLF